MTRQMVGTRHQGKGKPKGGVRSSRYVVKQIVGCQCVIDQFSCSSCDSPPKSVDQV
jgi:hypothetical protein